MNMSSNVIPSWPFDIYIIARFVSRPFCSLVQQREVFQGIKHMAS